MRNSIYSIAFCVILFSTKNIHAQSSINTENKKAFYLNGASGVAIPGLSDFNTILKSAGFLPFNNVYFARGGGFYTTFPKAKLVSIFNFSTYSGSKKDGVNSNWLRSTQMGTSLGVLLKNSNGWQLIPYGGVAYSFFGARVSGNTATGGNFTNYFLSPSNQHHVSSNQFVLNVGMHIAKTTIGSSKLGEKLVLGTRIGYYIPLGNSNWKTDDVKLIDGPKINAGGFYASFILGLKQ